MRLCDYSASKLKRVLKRKKLICFGSGDRFSWIFEAFTDMKFEEYIDYIVDNDCRKWGTTRKINGKEVSVCNPKILKTVNWTESIVMITALRVNEIFAQIQTLSGNPNVDCIRNITYRYEAGKWMERLLRRLPLTDSIVFQGEGDTCDNAKAFADYLLSNGKKHRIYWLCDHPEKFKETKKVKYIFRRGNLRKISYTQLWKCLSAMTRSKYLIFENQFTKKMRDDQITVYLNHGSPPLKSVKGKINLPSTLNYAVCPSENCADILAQQYSINKERLIYCGSPRTDILFTKKIDFRLLSFMNKDCFEHIILWVPTFRQHRANGRVDSAMTYEYGVPIMHSAEDWTDIADELKKRNILLIYKPHLLQKTENLHIPDTMNIRFITSEQLDEIGSDVYQLMKICDAMITDYSTIAFDFMLLNRMIGYTIDDMDKYQIGFSVNNPLDYMPGNKIVTKQDFIHFLTDVSNRNDRYYEERQKVNKWVHGNQMSGNYSGRLAEILGL